MGRESCKAASLSLLAGMVSIILFLFSSRSPALLAVGFAAYAIWVIIMIVSDTYGGCDEAHTDRPEACSGDGVPKTHGEVAGWVMAHMPDYCVGMPHIKNTGKARPIQNQNGLSRR